MSVIDTAVRKALDARIRDLEVYVRFRKNAGKPLFAGQRRDEWVADHLKDLAELRALRNLRRRAVREAGRTSARESDLLRAGDHFAWPA